MPHPFDMLAEKPRLRGECKGNIRPCPWISCRHNLIVDVLDESGGLVINAPIKRPEARGRAIVPKEWATSLFLDQAEDAVEFFFDEPDPSRPTCSLDEADRVGAEGMQLDEISNMMYVTRERVRQIEAEGLAFIRFLNDFANLNPNDPDDDHEHVRYVCSGGCGSEFAACPCDIDDDRKRTEVSHRLCTECKERAKLEAARVEFVEMMRARAEEMTAVATA